MDHMFLGSSSASLDNGRAHLTYFDKLCPDIPET